MADQAASERPLPPLPEPVGGITTEAGFIPLFRLHQLVEYGQACLSSADSAMEVKDILALAHRMAWRYKHSTDPHHSHTYTFNDARMIEFARALNLVSDSRTPLTDSGSKE